MSYHVDLVGLQKLFDRLIQQGYTLVGPTVKDHAIVYDEIASIDDLPVGWTDEQEAGRYRLARRTDNALFGFAVGPQSWKRFLHPPKQKLFQSIRAQNGFDIRPEPPQSAKYAFIGVRACELRAIEIQDRVFVQGEAVDNFYRANREGAFIIALNCSKAGGTCFCVSMNTGPKNTAGYDLALTEIIEESAHSFVVETGSDRGRALMDEIGSPEASSEHTRKAEAVVAKTAANMGRQMDTAGIKDLLQSNAEHPRWKDVASRCLTCANCTMVCPTCFCTTVEDVTDLGGDVAERWRRWDSCFTLDFSYVHGGSVRASTEARYRQWMTHKLASWFDQFGASGCVGCGRCITWCPAGIDITEEVQAIRESCVE
jgi:ferredoxin